MLQRMITFLFWIMRGCGGTWPNFSSGVLSSPMFNGRTLLGSLRVLIYNGRVPSSPPRVPSGPRLEWSGPGPRLSFTKILQWGRGVGGTLNTRAGCGRYLTETSRWGGSNSASNGVSAWATKALVADKVPIKPLWMKEQCGQFLSFCVQK